MYKDTYSALYEWNLRRWHGDEYTASWLTVFGLTGAVMMNIVVAGGAVVAVYGPDVFAPLQPKLVWPILIAIGFSVNYTTFIRRDRYKDLVQQLRNRGEAERRRVKALAWGYVIASYGLPVVFFFSLAVIFQQ